MIDIGPVAADDLEVAARVRAIIDVIRVEEIHRIRRNLTVAATVKHNVDFFARAVVFERGKAGALLGATAIRNALDGLQGLKVSGVIVVIGNNEIDAVAVTLERDRRLIHVFLNIRRCDNALCVSRRVDSKIAPPNIGGAVNTADNATGGGFRDQQRKAANLFAAPAGAIRVDGRRHLVPERRFRAVNALLDQVHHLLFTTVLETFQTRNGDGDGSLLDREASRRHRVVKRHVQELEARIKHKRLVLRIAQFLHDFTPAAKRFGATAILHHHQQSVIVGDVIRENLGAIFERGRDHIAPVNCSRQRTSHVLHSLISVALQSHV